MFKVLAQAAAGLLLLSPISALAAAPAPPPLEAYTRLPALERVTISPDGTKIAYIAMVGDKRRLGVQTLTGQPLGLIELGTQKVRDIRWGDDNHVLVTTSTYTDMSGAAYNKSDFYVAQSYNVANRTFVTLLDRTVGGNKFNSNEGSKYNAIAGPPTIRFINGKRVVFVWGFSKGGPATYEVDLDTGVGTRRERSEGEVLDPTGLAVAKEEYRKDDGGLYRLVVKEGAGWREVWSAKGYDIETPSLLGYGRTTDTLLVSMPENDQDNLYEINIATGKRKKLDFGLVGDVSPVYRSLTGELLGFSLMNGNTPDYIFLDQDMAEMWASVKAGFPNKVVRIASATPTYSKVVVFMSGDADSGTYMLVDVATRKAIKVGGQYPGVGPEAVAPKRYITYKAADGLEIPAYLTLPVGKEAKDLPLIVVPHGGPQGRDAPDFDWFTQVIASRGYAVLQPEFRGSDGFGRPFLEAGFGEWGKKMQTDVSDGVRALIAQGIVNPERVCIFGWSYGGYAALAGATIDSSAYRCAVAGAPVSDLRSMLAWERDQTGGKDTMVLRYWKRYMGANRINDGSLDLVSPAQQASRAAMPILLLHGKTDTNVPYAQSTIMADALKRAGKPYEFVDLQQDDHHLSYDASRQEAFRAIIAFLEKHNPPN